MKHLFALLVVLALSLPSFADDPYADMDRETLVTVVRQLQRAADSWKRRAEAAEAKVAELERRLAAMEQADAAAPEPVKEVESGDIFPNVERRTYKGMASMLRAVGDERLLADYNTSLEVARLRDSMRESFIGHHLAERIAINNVSVGSVDAQGRRQLNISSTRQTWELGTRRINADLRYNTKITPEQESRLTVDQGSMIDVSGVISDIYVNRGGGAGMTSLSITVYLRDED